MEARRLMDASGAHDPDDGPDRADGNARAPMMIQDPTTAAATRGRETEVWTKIREDHYVEEQDDFREFLEMEAEKPAGGHIQKFLDAWDSIV